MEALVEAGPFAAVNGEGKQLFEGVTVTLSEGQLVRLEGPSGGGKSTLLRQLVGLDAAAGARRVLDGVSCAPSEMSAWRAGVTLLAQDAPLLPGSLEHNLRFPFLLKAGAAAHFDPARAGSLLAAVGLGSLPLDREVRTLSGGERHRVALVRGLLWDPPVLLADEPLSGLDPDAASRCLELIREAAHRPGHAVLAVFHDPAMAAAADRGLRLTTHALEVS